MADLTGLWVFDYYYFHIDRRQPTMLLWHSLLPYKFLALDPDNNPTKVSWTSLDFDKYLVKRIMK